MLANEDVGRSIWLNGVFEAEETRYLKQVIRPGDICFDVGGNVGYMSILMAQCAASGHVHVFEPIPLNAAVIRVNVELNMLDNVTINQRVLSDEPGVANFSISTDFAYSSMRATGTLGEARSIRVEVDTLDHYLGRHDIGRVDVMKVDVEGAEKLVLKGGEQLLRDRSRRPRLLMFELFDANFLPYQTTVDEIVAMLKGWGYDAFVIAKDGSALTPLVPSMINVIFNIFFVSSDCRETALIL